MRDLVRAGKKDSVVRQTALSLIRHLPQKKWSEEIRTIFNFVRDQIRFVRDTAGVELIATPMALLELRQGDCDDKSVLLAALLESIGHPTRFVAVGKTPDVFDHVFVDTKIGGKWIHLDPTEQQEAGWEPPIIASKLIIHN